MKILIKTEYKFSYPVKLHNTPLQVCSYAIHPVMNTWMILVLGPDGEFYSVERKHAKYVTKLEEVLK